ncbi:Plasmodium vivax Vir protein, putative [Plasmodium vivax]|uniref:Vir protein, putative n=1 Tax=Plasmodium vivax TaxID=5855 RepID=A0A1G4E875_PLAVI|nr:Plasmodium vivax Vir protein, putative [Plasmodium vivax]SCA81710.1 Plasmodium vivax Vir protein, putative [Plasmodium vivax]
MENSIYTYVDRFPDFDSKILVSQVVNDREIKEQCEAFSESKLNTYGDKPQFIDKCKKIVKHLEDNKSNQEYKPAFCTYINYWLYDTLKDKVRFSSDELLDEFYDKIKKLNDCQTYKKYINEEIYNDLKELYELYEYLIKYKTESEQEQKQTCDKGDKCAYLYESYVVKCRWVYNPDYCDSLEKFKKEYEGHSSKKENKCSVSMQYLTPVGYNPVANFLNVTLAMSIITFVFIYFYKVCNNTILNIF